jgi:hypothetical protein
MEKTLQYALEEAIASGRRSATPVFMEIELREQIAQQLEAANYPGAAFIVRNPQRLQIQKNCY